MGEGLQWLIGAAFGVVTLIGGVIMRDRQMLSKISEGDEKLHNRINRVQDSYVRRDDLDAHIKRLETLINSMRDEQKETNKRIDSIITVLLKDK